MRLSEAIRLGSMLGPQLKDQLADGGGGSCAVRAAYLACGGKLHKEYSPLISTTSYYSADAFKEFRKLYPFFEVTKKTVCPGEGDHSVFYSNGSMWDTMVCLNNEHGWTREKIADWVEEQEVALGLIGASSEVSIDAGVSK